MAKTSASSEGFSPADFTDGRKPGDWKSRYPDVVAEKAIRFEQWYLALHLAMGILFVAIVYSSERPKACVAEGGGPISLQWQHLLLAWSAGLLGGTLFAIKWLYHSVAKWNWNADRFLWRWFTPHVSAVLAAAFVILGGSGILAIFDARAFQSIDLCFGLAFLVGYFSDSAIAKLTEIAETLFGPSRPNRNPRVEDQPKNLLSARRQKKT